MSRADRPFVWYELMTTDAAAARAFYGQVFGWESRPAGVPGIDYTLLSLGGRDVGGLFALTPQMCGDSAHPCWLGYIGSPDVDEDVRRVVAAGGKVLKEPTDIPGVGRFAVVADPHGAVFQLMCGNVDQPPAPVAPMTPGHVAWHELSAGDGAQAWEFYSRLFGWTIEQDMDMGPLGVYRIFAINGVGAGGMLTKTPEMPCPMWLFYVAVQDIDASMARAAAAGGKLLMGPHEVPGGAWIATYLDPQGAMFAMVGMRAGGGSGGENTCGG